MDDLTRAEGHGPHPVERAGNIDGATAPVAGAPDASAPLPLADARALTILTTEHWSLLSARSLVYNEAFARGGMFLTFLSGTFVALGLASTATGFSREFLAVTAIALGLDLFVGLATLGRIMGASREDLRYLQGMNRIRHAYHEIVPGIDRYFVTGRYDDAAGVFGAYGPPNTAVAMPTIRHALTTTPGMLSVINASIAAVLGGILVLLATNLAAAAIATGVLVLVAGVATSLFVSMRRIGRTAASLVAVFPTPRDPARPSAESGENSEADGATA